MYGYANYKAKTAVVPEYESDTYRKYAEAEAVGMSPAEYYVMTNTYDYDGSSSTGQPTQAEAQRYLDTETNLAKDQKADLWTIINKSWKNNPYDCENARPTGGGRLLAVAALGQQSSKYSMGTLNPACFSSLAYSGFISRALDSFQRRSFSSFSAASPLIREKKEKTATAHPIAAEATACAPETVYRFPKYPTINTTSSTAIKE